ncbi:MAG: histidine kinase with domain [Pseudarthrobacter sp.]|nr:histidine kinase with domain [Pseudarthrobacter sp.]
MGTEPWRSALKQRVGDTLREFGARAGELLHPQEQDSQSRQNWLEAGISLGDRLILPAETEDQDSFALVAETALRVSESAMAVIAVTAGHGVFRCRLSLGVQGLQAGEELPASDVVSAVFETGQSRSARSAWQVFDPEVAGKLGSVLACALGHSSSDRAVLLLARPHGSSAYSQSDVDSSSLFGRRIGLALDMARVHALREQNLLFRDRERIARDVHDLVIQRLFAAGLGIQSLRRLSQDPVARERIDAVTAELDGTIRTLRDTIYSLRTGDGEREVLTSRVMKVVQENSRSYPVLPRVNFSGPVDDTVPDHVARHLLSVLSEGLSNAMRHSGADEIQVTLSAGPKQVELRITDNGRGFEEPVAASGLTNMRDRAGLLGGTCTIRSVPGKGTRIAWSACCH